MSGFTVFMKIQLQANTNPDSLITITANTITAAIHAIVKVLTREPCSNNEYSILSSDYMVI